jgi:glycosyltransferase involved in cell wall biosynthesis
MRVALVYDRLNKIGGAEKVLVAFSELYPDADWYTSVWESALTPFAKGWKIHTSWLSKVPFLRTHHEWIPYLMPFVFESFDFGSYDLLISIGSAESKGIITKPGTVHLNYCLTPTRYLYSHQAEYLSNSIYRFIAKFLRKWDLVASTRPDKMIAISTQVKSRIQNIYKRDSEIIFPPVDTAKFSALVHSFTPAFKNYYLTVARLVPYKKVDVLIKTFNQNGKTLLIIGDGSENDKLSKLAKKNIHLLGSVSDSELPGYYQHAKAFLQANEEDFGIAMCEAQASGIPVIAYKAGGALDIVKDQKTGILVEHNKVMDFKTAIDIFETMTFDREVCRLNAKRFDKEVWIKQIEERISKL